MGCTGRISSYSWTVSAVLFCCYSPLFSTRCRLVLDRLCMYENIVPPRFILCTSSVHLLFILVSSVLHLLYSLFTSAFHLWYIFGTSLFHPFYIQYSALFHPLYICFTSSFQPCFILCTSMFHPLYIFRIWLMGYRYILPSLSLRFPGLLCIFLAGYTSRYFLAFLYCGANEGQPFCL